MFGGKKAAKSPSGGGSGAKPKNNDLANMVCKSYVFIFLIGMLHI